MRRGNQDRINIYDLHYYMKQPKKKDMIPVNDFFKVRSSHRNMESKDLVSNKDSKNQHSEKLHGESDQAIKVNFDFVPSTNPKFSMP